MATITLYLLRSVGFYLSFHKVYSSFLFLKCLKSLKSAQVFFCPFIFVIILFILSVKLDTVLMSIVQWQREQSAESHSDNTCIPKQVYKNIQQEIWRCPKSPLKYMCSLFKCFIFRNMLELMSYLIMQNDWDVFLSKERSI